MLDLEQTRTTAKASLLRLDGELCSGLPSHSQDDAARLAAVEVLDLRIGALELDGALRDGELGFGLMVTDGLLCRHVGRGSRSGAELVGPGDVFRPWDLPGAWASIPVTSRWTVLIPSRIAVLDRGFAGRMAVYPEVGIAIHRRGLRRAADLATLLNLTNYRRVETRLLLLFWHLADRFGSVGTDSIKIPIPLTHAVIAEMAALRRPSVTTGLAQLSGANLLRRSSDGWILLRSSAENLIEAG